MNLRPLLEKLHPMGTHGGQCGVFVHTLVQFPPLGDSLQAKTDAVNRFGIPLAQLPQHGGFRVGDVLITNESTVYGHVAFINALVGNFLQLTESNYHLDEKVTHVRLLSSSSLHIIGVIRGKLLFLMNQAIVVKSKKSPTVYICYPMPSMDYLNQKAELEGFIVPEQIPDSDSLI